MYPAAKISYPLLLQAIDLKIDIPASEAKMPSEDADAKSKHYVCP